MDLAVEQQHAAIVPLLNASTAAQLACPELLHVGEVLPGQQQTLQPLLLPIQQGLTLVHHGSRSAHYLKNFHHMCVAHLQATMPTTLCIHT